MLGYKDNGGWLSLIEGLSATQSTTKPSVCLSVCIFHYTLIAQSSPGLIDTGLA